MNPVDLLLKAEAATSGRARARRLRRHAHLEPYPLAVAALQMAGEPYALWAALVGTDCDHPRLIVAPEPRNLNIAFHALAELAQELCSAVDRAAADPCTDVARRDGTSWARCTVAPQLLVANRAVVNLLDRLGRRMRPAGFGGHVHVPPEVNLAGAHLGFFAEAARHPGSALVLVATEELSRHIVTGQSALEDAHLGSQLAWSDPALVEEIAPGCLAGRDPAATHGAEAAACIESLPMGVLTDPREDNAALVNAVERFNAARAGATDPATVTGLGAELVGELRQLLLPTWRALWIAHGLLNTIPPAPGADLRWERDLGLFTRHVEFLEAGGRRALVDSARRAAMLLADWERAQAAVERDEVLEDPLALAAALAAGQAVEGTVLAVDATHREVGPSGKTSVSRPLLTLACADSSPFPAGTELWWTLRPGEVRVEVQSSAPTGSGAEVVFKVLAGMRGALPEVGQRATFSICTTTWVPPAPLPAETPWTHMMSDDSDLELDVGPALEGVLVLGGVR